MRTPEEIENEKVEKEKELQSLNTDISVIDLACGKFSVQIDQIRLQKREQENELIVLKARRRKLESDIKILTSEFWAKRRT